MNNLSILDYAMKNSPFYQKKYSFVSNSVNINDDLFKKLPLLYKRELQNAGDNIFCKNSGTSRLQIYKTSGTTGMPLHIYWNSHDYIKSMMYLWNSRRIWYGILPQDPYATFHSVASNGEDTKILNAFLTHQNRVLSLGRYIYSEQMLAYYFACWQEFDPVWIQGCASVLMLFADYKTSHQITLRKLRYIELVGEYVDQATQLYIADAFGVPVANMYGSVEFNGIALTCPYGHMHILKNNVYVENIKQKGYDSLVITGLNNTYMPIIRYNIGDVGDIYRKDCSCGNHGLCLDIKRGRHHELVKLSNSVYMDPDLLTNIVETINQERLIVRQFCVVKQNDALVLRLFVLPQDEKYVLMLKPFLLKRLKTLQQKNVNFEIELVSDIYLSESNAKFTFLKDESFVSKFSE